MPTWGLWLKYSISGLCNRSQGWGVDERNFTIDFKHENEKGERELFRRKVTLKNLGIGSFKRVIVLIPLSKSKDTFFGQSTQALFSVRQAYFPKAGLEETALTQEKVGFI